MATKKSYNPGSKRAALALWTALNAALLGAMILPLYLYWERLASRPVILLLILGLLAWTLFNGAKLTLIVVKWIRSLPEQ